MSAPVLRVSDLHKTFRIGFFRKKVEAVRGIGFEVRPGEIFGLLGPNGAGKTTTIKMVLRLIFPMRGAIELFGKANPGPSDMVRLGYLPENPYIYQYLKPLEFLDLCGRLTGMDAASRGKRAREMIAKVGLEHAVDRPIGKFSKGMMQRVGLAQALLHDPELLVLDEPMSGLDPIGRKEVRDLIVEQRQRGKTILFTSHILSDVEMLCDRVGIMQRGKMSHYGNLGELLKAETRRAEVELEEVSPELLEELRELATELREVDGRVHLVVTGEEGAQPVIERAVAKRARVVAVTPARETLEDLFVRDALREDEARA
ncbi:MAG: ABC transporter ATP-binding protein [Sandaracinaceae bacterium]|nr:ABC transporter ATP-binding protein [Sandaracinaceae bacterium]